MDRDRKATCYYKYEIEGKEKTGQAELSEEFKQPTSRDFLSINLISVIKNDEPDYFLQTPQHHQTFRSGYLVGPAKIVFGWDTEFERGLESGAIDGYDFYRKDKPLKP